MAPYSIYAGSTAASSNDEAGNDAYYTSVDGDARSNEKAGSIDEQ
jgi:hypothetical protein